MRLLLLLTATVLGDSPGYPPEGERTDPEQDGRGPERAGPAKIAKIRGADLVVGKAKAAEGRFRLAAAEFREVLEKRPNYHQAKVGLGEALAGLGKCDEALSWLDQVPRSKVIWTSSAASAEALCRYRRGDLSGAIAAYEEAIRIGPDETEPWMQLAIIVSHAGEPGEALRIVEEMSEIKGSETATLVAYSWIACEAGSEDLDRYLTRMEGIGGVGAGPLHTQRLLMDGIRWMDLGHLELADERFEQALRYSMGHSRTSTWKAEVLRRLGDLSTAEYLLTREMFTQDDSHLRLAMLVRLRVDQGDLAGAREILRTHPAPFDPEALASAWYLARAERDQVRAAEKARQWAAVNPNRLRELEQLVPLQAETP